ncbi:hypothetical protein L2E82_35496 [Cichorium intybus]|uniref:Uncharacterized protein n=1 Tax=Cichorium intybus TaxID=13427 RepID=A0ACB9BNY8_CICIN|nr:hypothetical protein L2E82_35496 [Cichorium intybus]
MDSNRYISDEGEGSANNSIEMNEVSEDGEAEEEYESDHESYNSNVIESPSGKMKLWQPVLPKEYMVDVKATYESLDDAINMYKLYVEKAGFDVHLYSQNEILTIIADYIRLTSILTNKIIRDGHMLSRLDAKPHLADAIVRYLLVELVSL